MKKIYWLRRTGGVVMVSLLGTIITGHFPDWLKAVYAMLLFGLALIYDFAEYDVKKASEGAD